MNNVLPTSASLLVSEQCNFRCTYCLTGDTRIMMADYTEKEIKYIKEGELILGFDEYQNNKGQDRNVFPSKVLQLHERESEVLEITLENGYKINITENHKVLTINVWCEAKFLNIYDEVMVLDKGNQKLIPSKVKEIKEVGFVKVYNIGTESRTYIANNIAVHNCFEKHKNNYMTKEVMRKALDFLFNNAVKQNEKSVFVTMFGGEPMMNYDIVEEGFSYGHKLSKETGVNFSVNIITNSSILTDKMIESLKFWRDKVNLNVQLSIDGIKEVQDEYRVLPNGSPTFDIVFKNIPKWKGIFSDRPSSLSVHGCINKKTMKYLYINYKYFRDCLGFNRIWYLPIAEENWDEDDIKEYRKQMGLIYDNIVSIVQNENSLNEVYNYAPLDRCFNLGNRSNKPCGAGTNYITINTLGEVFPCHQFYFNDPDKDTLIGNIYTGLDTSKQKVFLEYTNDWFAGCNKCEHGNCYRCIANNYQHRGSMFSQTQGFYCTLMMIDLFYQTKLRKVLIDMGLINNKTNQNNSNGCDLNCRVHTSSTENGCDVVSGTHNDTTNYNHFKELDRTFIEYVNKDNKTYGKYILSDGSIELLEKVDNKENEVRNNKCSCNKDETDNDLEVIASALHLILDKLDEVLLKLK